MVYHHAIIVDCLSYFYNIQLEKREFNESLLNH